MRAQEKTEILRKQRMESFRRKKRRKKRIIKRMIRGSLLIGILLLFMAGVKEIASQRARIENRKQENKSASISAEENKTIHEEQISAVQAAELMNSGYSSEILNQLQSLAENEPKIYTVFANIAEYPEKILELLANNPETIDFVIGYPENRNNNRIEENIDISDLYTPGEIPFFLQWDMRWGYCQYGEGMIALDGCGPTCLAMVVAGLKGDSSMNPAEMACFSESKGYISESGGTTWDLMTEGVQDFGVSSQEIPLDEGRIQRELESGHPIICSMRPGDFTTTGHFIVLYGYEGDKFRIHDPNSKERSKKLWSYSEIQYQIKNLWAFSF